MTATVLINSTAAREKALAWIKRAPWNTYITFRESKRSTAQNDLMWAMITDIASQMTWHGQRLSTDDWKLVFMAGLNQEMRIVPNINGNGFVNLGRSSSKLTKDEMGQLIDLIEAFGAQHNIIFKNATKEAA